MLLPYMNSCASPGAFAFYAPKMYQEYADVLGRLFEHDSALKWNFNNSIFPAATINFGPQSVCYDHLDSANRAVGWCDIFAMGDYDCQKGGHLVLFDIETYVVFPPGSHILIPSAIMRHGNTPIGDNETRLGFTQYAAGGLFRWVDNGFKKAPKRRKNKKYALELAARFKKSIGMFSTVEGLLQDRLDAFGKPKSGAVPICRA